MAVATTARITGCCSGIEVQIHADLGLRRSRLDVLKVVKMRSLARPSGTPDIAAQDKEDMVLVGVSQARLLPRESSDRFLPRLVIL